MAHKSFAENARVIARGVKDAEDDHAVGFDAIEYFVGETSGDQSAESTIIERRTLRLMFEAANQLPHLSQKFLPQAAPLALIPLPRPLQIAFGARADRDRPAHF